MKDKKVKYNEAVERNVKTLVNSKGKREAFLKSINISFKTLHKQNKNHSDIVNILGKLKHRTGIKQSDSKHDEVLLNFLFSTK